MEVIKISKENVVIKLPHRELLRLCDVLDTIILNYSVINTTTLNSEIDETSDLLIKLETIVSDLSE